MYFSTNFNFSSGYTLQVRRRSHAQTLTVLFVPIRQPISNGSFFNSILVGIIALSNLYLLIIKQPHLLPDIVIPVLLFIVAFLYASVGHGGASGYIAVLTLFSIPKLLYKPVVLIMNTIIAGIAFIQFYRAGYFKWKLAWPFLITSIPCAFLGSKHVVSDNLYNMLLGAALLFPMVRLMVISAKDSGKIKPLKLLPAFFWGALIGFVSGFLNIGGGIFLSPVIVLMGWGNTKDAAAVSSLFIVCNSLAGLAADKAINIHFTSTTYTWLIAAVVGGLAGSYLGSRHFNLITVRYILSAVLCIAAVKLIFS